MGGFAQNILKTSDVDVHKNLLTYMVYINIFCWMWGL